MKRLKEIKKSFNSMHRPYAISDTEIQLIEMGRELIDEVERLRDRVSIIDAVEETNRTILDECKRVNAVNERLRRVEAAALDTDKCVCEFPDDLGACQESFEQLHAVLHNNPRPEG